MEWSTRTISTSGGPFLIHEGGDGPLTFLFLHDEISTQPSPLATRLAASGRVVAPVHPGFGTADRPEWVESVRDVAEHYVDLLASLALPAGTAVAGASMGAWIAAELAIRANCRFAALSLINPIGVHVPGHPAKDLWFIRDPETILFADVRTAPAVPAGERVANEESAARYGWSPRLHDPALPPRLHRLRLPVQLVWGTGDQLLPKEHLQRWQELLPAAEVAEIPSVGHFPGYESPEQAAAAITSFIARHVHRGEQQ